MLINFNIHLIILAELAHLAGVLLSQPQLVRWKSIFQARHFRELFVFFVQKCSCVYVICIKGKYSNITNSYIYM